MADIILSIGAKIERTSLGSITREVKSALKDSGPTVSIDVDPKDLRKIHNQVRNATSIPPLGPRIGAEFEKIAKRGIKIKKFDFSEAVKGVRKGLEDEVKNAKIKLRGLLRDKAQAEARITGSPKGVAGAGRVPRKEPDVKSLQKQISKAEKELLGSLAKRVLVEEAIADEKRKREGPARNINRQINKVLQQRRQGLISTVEAQKKIENLTVEEKTQLGRQTALRLKITSNRLSAERKAEQAVAQENATLRASSNARLAALGITQKEISAAQQGVKNLQDLAKGIKASQGQNDTAFDKIRKAAVDFANRLRNQGRGKGKGSGSPQAALDFTKKGAIQKFSGGLKGQELVEFSKKLEEISRSADISAGRVGKFGRASTQASAAQRGMNSQLAAGSGQVKTFGQAVGFATKRLLAWGPAAAIIFGITSRLREAAQEIVRLDSEARRLVFFEKAGLIMRVDIDSAPVKDFVNATSGVTRSLKDIREAVTKSMGSTDSFGQSMNKIISTSKKWGISTNEVAETLITLARTGQEAFDKTTGMETAFAKATLSLVRMEGSALGAESAVRGLTAIQAQFLGGKTGFVFKDLGVDEIERAELAMQGAANASNLLAATAANSSASVSELIDATTRLGSAFNQISGLKMDQTIAILGEAFTATGATTGRLATALRQTSTLIAQNSEKIEEITGIKVTNADGVIRDFSVILDVLRKVRDTAGSVGSVELSKLIADRRNLADMQALAANVDNLTASYAKFKDPAEAAKVAGAAAVQAFIKDREQAEKLEAKINTLSASFTEFFQVVVGGDALGSFTDGLIAATQAVTSIVNGVKGFLEAIPDEGRALINLSVLGLGVAAVKSLTAGFFSAFKGAQLILSPLGQANRLLLSEGKLVEGIQKLRSAGLITEAQRDAFLQKANQLQAHSLTLTRSLNKVRDKLALVESQGIGSQKIKNQLVREESLLVSRIAATRQALAVQGSKVSAAGAATKSAATTTRLSGAGAAIGVIAATTLAGSAVEENMEEGASKGITKGIINGMTAAAGVAMFLPGAGWAVALKLTAAGALLGGIVSAFSESKKEAKKFAEQLEGAKTLGPQLVKMSKERQDILNEFNKLDKTQEEKEKAKTAFDRIDQLLVEKALLEKQISLQRGSVEEHKQTIEAIKAETASLAESVVNLQKQVTAAKARADAEKQAAKMLRENARLGKVLANEFEEASNKAKARAKIQQNIGRLKGQEFKNTKAVKNAEQQLNFAASEREKIFKRLAAQKDILSQVNKVKQAVVVGQAQKLELEIELDESSFKQALAAADEKIKALEQERKASAVKEGGQEKVIEQIRKVEEKRQKSVLKRIGQIISRQRAVFEEAKKNSLSLIKGIEGAGNAMSSALDEAVSKQENIANIFRQIGDINKQRVEEAFSSMSSFLERTGGNAVEKLKNIQSTADEQIAVVRDTFANVQDTLSKRFTDTSGIKNAAKDLTELMGEVISKSDKDISDVRSGALNSELAEQRQRLVLQKADFSRRLGETNREIQARRELLNEEIRIIKEKAERERQVHETRMSQQEEFGKLLISSPKEFKKTVKNIGLARQFFGGVKDLSLGSLEKVSKRIDKLRGTPGGNEMLKLVQSGISSAVRFGVSDIIPGVGNRLAEQSFNRLPVAGATEVSEDIKRQADEANQRTKEQQAITKRQEELVRLGQEERTIQGVLADIARSEAEAQGTHRGILEDKLETQISALGQIKSSLDTMEQAVTGTLKSNIDVNQFKDALSGAELGRQLLNALRQVIKPRAEGGSVRKGRHFLVGEKGPELFTPSIDGEIVPNDRLKKIAKQLVRKGEIRALQDGTPRGRSARLSVNREDEERARELRRVREARERFRRQSKEVDEASALKEKQRLSSIKRADRRAHFQRVFARDRTRAQGQARFAAERQQAKIVDTPAQQRQQRQEMERLKKVLADQRASAEFLAGRRRQEAADRSLRRRLAAPGDTRRAGTIETVRAGPEQLRRIEERERAKRKRQGRTPFSGRENVEFRGELAEPTDLKGRAPLPPAPRLAKRVAQRRTISARETQEVLSREQDRRILSRGVRRRTSPGSQGARLGPDEIKRDVESHQKFIGRFRGTLEDRIKATLEDAKKSAREAEKTSRDVQPKVGTQGPLPRDLVAQESADKQRRREKGRERRRRVREERERLKEVGIRNKGQARREIERRQPLGALGKRLADEDFIKGARGLREKRVRNIDVEDTRKFLKNEGFEGLAGTITAESGSRGAQKQAARALDKLLKISENMQRDQEKRGPDAKPSARTERGLKDLASGELLADIKGGKDVEAAITDLIGPDRVKTKIVEASEVGAAKMGESITTASNKLAETLDDFIGKLGNSLSDTKVKVDMEAMKGEITIRMPDALDEAGLTQLFTTLFAKLGLDSTRVDRNAKLLTQLYNDLAKTGIVLKPMADTNGE